MKETEYLVSLSTFVFPTEEYNARAKSEELTGAIEYLTL